MIGGQSLSPHYLRLPCQFPLQTLRCGRNLTSTSSSWLRHLSFMRQESSPLRALLTIGLVTTVVYFVVFYLIESRRHRQGPWELTFAQAEQFPTLHIRQPDLGISNVTLVFVGGSITSSLPQTIRFRPGQVAPLDLPFGRCVFLDVLFQPGTVACEIFGHEIQLLPRTLTVNRAEIPWTPNQKILLTNRPPATLPLQ